MPRRPIIWAARMVAAWRSPEGPELMLTQEQLFGREAAEGDLDQPVDLGLRLQEALFLVGVGDR